MVGPPSDVNRIAALFFTDAWISSGPFIDQSEQEKPGILPRQIHGLSCFIPDIVPAADIRNRLFHRTHT